LTTFEEGELISAADGNDLSDEADDPIPLRELSETTRQAVTCLVQSID
jgi:hypothetical protein